MKSAFDELTNRLGHGWGKSKEIKDWKKKKTQNTISKNCGTAIKGVTCTKWEYQEKKERNRINIWKRIWGQWMANWE